MPSTASTPARPSLALHEFEAVALLHEGICFGCLAEAERASIMARVTGSSGATHRSQAVSLTGEVTDEHFATVQRRGLPKPAPVEVPPASASPSPWTDLFSDGKSGLFEL